jgi:hypothetical protein
MAHNDSPAAAFADRAVAFFSGTALRLLTHCLSLAAAAIACAASPAALPRAHAAFLVIAVYVGCVCLFPGGARKRADWIVPTAVGVSQCLIWSIWGLPWRLTILWGGLQTWTIRLLVRKGAPDWDWTAAPWLLIALYGFISHLAPPPDAPFPLPSFPVFTVCGWGILFLHKRRGVTARLDAWGEASRAIRSKAHSLPARMRAAVHGITGSADKILDILRADPQSAAAGASFLSRYLEATRAVADDYARLAGREGADQDLSRSVIILERLEKAFADEYARLLRRDAATFAADLKVLDALLRIDGK